MFVKNWANTMSQALLYYCYDFHSMLTDLPYYFTVSRMNKKLKITCKWSSGAMETKQREGAFNTMPRDAQAKGSLKRAWAEIPLKTSYNTGF